MENILMMLGPKGLIKKHEFVRLIIQSLSSFGYRKSASCLELESGISYKSAEFKKLESQLLNANWDDCICTLNGIEHLMDDTRTSAFFVVTKQYMLKCLNSGDVSMALKVLQKWVSSMQVDREMIYKLAFCIVFSKDTGIGKIDGSDIIEQRKRMLEELERLLPPPVTLPEGRLEHLVEVAVSAQLDSCAYHNSDDAVSLYGDHCCGQDQIPTETVQILKNHRNEVWFVKFSNNGDYLASSSSDCTAIIWKVLEDGSLTLRHTLQSHENPVALVAWSPDDRLLLTCGNVEVLKLWNVETGTCQRTFGDHGFIISCCAWFPDSNRFVCGSPDPGKGIRMWDCLGNEVRAWQGARMPKVLDLAVTPDGEHLITVFADKDILVLNVHTNGERVISEDHPVTSISVSGDGKFLVNLNGLGIHMWDVVGEWKEPAKYLGHEQRRYVIRSCFGGINDAFVASGSEDSMVYIWNRRGSYPIEVLSGHLMSVNCVSWNPKRPRMLASASDDHTIRIWGPTSSEKLCLDGSPVVHPSLSAPI